MLLTGVLLYIGEERARDEGDINVEDIDEGLC